MASARKRSLNKDAESDPAAKRVKINAPKGSGGSPSARAKLKLTKMYTHTDPDTGKHSARLYKKDESYMRAQRARLARRKKRQSKKKSTPGKKKVAKTVSNDEDENPEKILEFSDLTNRFQGQVAIVTGGGGGIGQVAALRLAKEGATVIVLDNRKWVDTLKWCEEHGTGKDASYYAYKVDVADKVALDKCIKEIYEAEGMIDVLVNCAWTHKGDTLSVDKISDTDIDKVLGVNFRGTFHAIQAVVPYMRKNRYGRIVNIVSSDAVAASSTSSMDDEKQSGMMERVLQASASGAVISMQKAMSRELGVQGILMNAVMMQRYTGDDSRVNPLGRHGLRGEIAAVISFAASEENSFTIGSVYDASGGLASY